MLETTTPHIGNPASKIINTSSNRATHALQQRKHANKPLPQRLRSTMSSLESIHELRKSSSSRFGKNMLMTLFGSNNGEGESSQSSTTIPVDNLDTSFETLLDELNMKDTQKHKLRQLPRDQKLYLLQQNQHIKFNHSPTPTASASISLPKRVQPTLSPQTPTQPPRERSYKFNHRRDLVASRNSKVGSMILEFDALAQPQDADPAEWLILADVPASKTTDIRGHQSLSRREGIHLAALTEGVKQSRDGASPYFYVERLRNRNTPIEALTKHLASLKATLAAGNTLWINEFLSRRHDGLSALESVLERLNTKRKKKRIRRLNEADENCFFECLKCLQLLLDTDPGAQQVLMRPAILHHLVFALLAIFAAATAQDAPTSIPKSSSTTSLVPASTGTLSSAGNESSEGMPLRLRMGTMILKILSGLCLLSMQGYSIVLSVISEIQGEQYRFQRLVEGFGHILGIDMPEATQCQAAAISLFNAIANTPETIETRRSVRAELERRGLDEKLQELMIHGTELVDPLKSQTTTYLEAKQEDQELFIEFEKTKRESLPQLQPHAVVSTAMKRFSSDTEVYYMVLDSVSSLLELGGDKLESNKRLVHDLWTVVSIFINQLKTVTSAGEIQQALQAFLRLIQPIVGKFVPDAKEADSCVLNAAVDENQEDTEGLRSMVEELREKLEKSEEAMARMRREKNELMMKVTKAQADLKYSRETTAPQSTTETEEGNAVRAQSSCGNVPPPPPPPPPQPTSPVVMRRNTNIAKRKSVRASKYLHPLALNLCFSNLKSLQENAVSPTTSPTSDGRPYSFSVMDVEMQQQMPIMMKQFFWSKLPQERIQHTVWKEIISPDFDNQFLESPLNSSCSETDDDEHRSFETVQKSRRTNTVPPVQLDTTELERLFKKSKTNGSPANDRGFEGSKVRKTGAVTLLEFNRANNIAIMLARIKLSYPEIRDAIWNIDDNRLTVENLIAIRQYIPTKEEIEIVKEYEGDVEMLGNAERYFRAIMYIPRLSDRVSCMIFRRRFKQELQELLPQLDTLQGAICELRESTRFKKVLRTVLAIGNYLNNQTIRGNAYGFRIDALLKMRDTRAEGEGVSNMPTLLHYLVHFLTKSEDDVVDFRQDIVHLEQAAKISPPTLFASVNALSGQIAQIKEELSFHQRRRRTSMLQIDRFAEAMEEFLIEAEPIVCNLKSLSKDTEEKLKDIIMYYGEDPAVIKSDDFFNIIQTFCSSFTKAQSEIYEARERALRRQKQQEMLKARQLKPNTSSSTSSVTEFPVTLSRSPSFASFDKRSASLSSSTVSQEEKTDAFENVLRELRAGLRQGEHSWRTNVPIRFRRKKSVDDEKREPSTAVASQ